MCIFPYWRHKWYDVPGVIYSGVYVFFARPAGKAKMQYCERCGDLRLVGLNTKLQKDEKSEPNVQTTNQ